MSPRVGLLWRREWDPPSAEPPRLGGVFASFSELGVEAEPVVYSDDTVEAVREQLLRLDGVLVWVNPIEQGLDRSLLDPLLREVAGEDVFVSAHPDVILRMGTKEVLVETRSMTWGTDTVAYRTGSELQESFPRRLAEHRTLVLKQHRGMGGQGVWKVEDAGRDTVVVQHAASGARPAKIPLVEFLDQCDAYFAAGPLVEQPYQPRLAEGMIRAYLSHDTVVGFAHQYPRGLLPPDVEPPHSEKRFETADEPRYAPLRERLEAEWVPEMQRILEIETPALPVIWDADFLLGEDGYILCEINASSTFAFPEFAMPAVARAALDRIGER